MKQAVVSDIHGNLEAIEAVLAHVRSLGIARICCLGDIVGYGPNPLECIDLAMQFHVCLLGNHDRAVLFDPESFSRGAEQAICWTRQQLADRSEDENRRQRRWDFLNELHRTYNEDGYLLVHASARNPLDEYIFPEDVHNRRKLDKIFAQIQRHCFVGHTHIPGILTAGGKFLGVHEVKDGYRLGAEKTIVNVGSVGQPRDGDPRACLAILDGQTVSFQRVPYPVARTVEKIHAIAQLDRFLGDRLLEGR